MARPLFVRLRKSLDATRAASNAATAQSRLETASPNTAKSRPAKLKPFPCLSAGVRFGIDHSCAIMFILLHSKGGKICQVRLSAFLFDV